MNQQTSNRKPKKQFDDFIRYSSLAFEMIAIMAGMVWLGVKLDQWLEMSFPVFTLGLMVVSVIVAIYYAIRKFL